MNKLTITILLLGMFNWMNSGAQESNIAGRIDKKEFDPASLLWYDAPAKEWEEALPVGNGRLGAMVFGKYGEERIQLNEETYWSGGPYSTVVKGGAEVLPDIQKYIFEGQPLKAHKLFGRYMMGYPVEQQKYQSVANLHLFFEGQDEVSAYKRWLDLNSGVSSVEYSVNGISYRRDVISSAPDQVVLVRLTASKPGSISFRAQLRGCRNQAHSNYATDYFRMDGQGNDGLVVTGKSADYMGVEGKIRYRAQLKAIPEGGTVEVDDIDLTIKGADAVTLCFVAATNFVNYKDVSANQDTRVENYLKGIEAKSYDTMRDEAVKDYQSYFNRVSLKLESTENSFLPTDKRIARYVDEAEENRVKDPSLASLCYNFGRYLLISSSRPGTEPPNVQGIWNEKMNPKWDSKYCSNINTPMNYWAIESANLSELSEPLTTMVKELTDQGAQVAKEHYGARGWVFHQCTDLWRVAAPMDGPTWGTFTVGGAWLTTHLWEHYLYTLDTEYLREVYPVIKGSVTFFMDFLVEHPNGKWLVTNPSNSPENPPQAPGYQYFFDEVTGFNYFTTICAGASIDMQILTDLFAYYIEATEILDMDEGFANEVAKARQRLVPPQIGADGTLQEWTDDWKQAEDEHRHLSHMYGLYPGNVFSASRTPQFTDALKGALEQREDGGTGFSRAWKMALWARLYDGDRAYSIFKGYLKDQACHQLFAKCFDILQVDGSMGVTAGITEMLMQSHEDIIHLLPAIPNEWTEGRFDGVCARGGFELDMQWENKKITEVEILSKAGKTCHINTGEKFTVSKAGKKVASRTYDDGSIEFATIKGGSYKLIRK